MTHRATNGLILATLAAYAGVLFVLFRFDAIDDKAVVTGITLLFGWLLTLLVAWLRLQKSQEDSRKAAAEERRADLRTAALRDVLIATQRFASTTTEMWVALMGLSQRLVVYPSDLRRKETEKAMFADLPMYSARLAASQSEWGVTIESHQIALLEIDHFRLFIQFRTLDLFHRLVDLSVRAQPVLSRSLSDNAAFEEFDQLAKPIVDDLNHLQAFLHDFRVILLNFTCAELFGSAVPDRVPLDPRYSRLEEVATPESVEDEARDRERRAVQPGTTTTAQAHGSPTQRESPVPRAI
jgi:hypothetical protein